MDYKEFKNKLSSNRAFVEESSKPDLNFEISQMIIDARLMRGLTQKQLADLVGTKQPSIARIESGMMLPTLPFLEKIAKALKTNLVAPKFSLAENLKVTVNSVAHQDTEQFPSNLKINHYVLVTPKVQAVRRVDKNIIFNQ